MLMQYYLSSQKEKTKMEKNTFSKLNPDAERAWFTDTLHGEGDKIESINIPGVVNARVYHLGDPTKKEAPPQKIESKDAIDAVGIICQAAIKRQAA
jgi:hypothetical protein